jgi:stage III sporulation protein SpoIIIAA
MTAAADTTVSESTCTYNSAQHKLQRSCTVLSHTRSEIAAGANAITQHALTLAVSVRDALSHYAA